MSHPYKSEGSSELVFSRNVVAKEDVNSLVRRIEKTILVGERGDLVYPDDNVFLA